MDADLPSPTPAEVWAHFRELDLYDAAAVEEFATMLSTYVVPGAESVYL